MEKKSFINEFELMRGFRHGKEANFDIVFRELYPALCFFAFKIMNNRAAAEDIAQESFIKIWERRDTFQKWNVLKSYLYTTVKNASINWSKKINFQENVKKEMVRGDISEERYLFESLVAAEVMRELTTAMEKLSPQTKEVVKLIYYEGRKIKEVAAILGISASTVKTLKARALVKLKGNIGFIILYFLHQ